jgi:hypothetical protein
MKVIATTYGFFIQNFTPSQVRNRHNEKASIALTLLSTTIIHGTLSGFYTFMFASLISNKRQIRG